MRYLYLSITPIAVCMFTGCHPAPPPAERAVNALDTTHLSGQATLGQKAFRTECGKCHQVIIGMNRKAPQLKRIFGAPAASLSDYERYSSALKNSQIVWTAERLDAYMKNPKQYVPQGKMLYDGLADSQQRQDIIAYLATLR